MKRTLLNFLLIVAISTSGLSQQKHESKLIRKIGFSPNLSYKMLDPNQNLRKVNILLEAIKNGRLNQGNFIIGFSLIAIADYQHSNTNSKFAYLMRHPTSNNQIGKTVSEAVIHSFQLSFIGTINSWITAYSEILYNPEQSFGSGTITTLSRNQLQLRKAFILIGNLNKSPFYGALGKLDTPFGQTGSVNPFTNSTMWHAFGGLGYGAQLGFKKRRVQATLMAIQGGAQFRALHTTIADSTSVPSKINNFTADLNYTFNLKNNITFLLGGSYLHGSSYCQNFPITHFSNCKSNNPAYAYYAKFKLLDNIILKGSFAKTLKVWPGTHNPTFPLSKFAASKVSSFDIGVKYNLNTKYAIRYVISSEFSNFRAGPKGSPWERQNQLVIGFIKIIF